MSNYTSYLAAGTTFGVLRPVVTSSVTPTYTSTPSQPTVFTTDARGVVFVQSSGIWSPVYIMASSSTSAAIVSPSPSPSNSTANPVQSVESAQSSNSDEPQKGLPLTATIGISIAVVLLFVAGVVGWMWVRHRRAKAGRQDARVMREIGRERPMSGNGGAWPFESSVELVPALPPLAPITREALGGQNAHLRSYQHRQSASTWADDSEIDMVATDGSTLARTLSTRSTSSTSTIRTLSSNPRRDRQTLDHPGYTYMSSSRSTGAHLLPGSVSRSNSSRSPHSSSPFTDSAYPTNISPITINTSSPFADPSSYPRISPPTSTQHSSPIAYTQLPSPAALAGVSPTSTDSSSPSSYAQSPNVYTQSGAAQILTRPESRISTVSSENPFRDPLPAYTLEASGRVTESTFGIPVFDAEAGLERQLQRPPPAYAENERGLRRSYGV